MSFKRLRNVRFGAGDSRDAMESVINEETKHLMTELTKHIGKPIDIKVTPCCKYLDIHYFDIAVLCDMLGSSESKSGQ